jgi:uncharacterized protein
VKQGFKVMDSDIHVREPHDLWARYIEPLKMPPSEYFRRHCYVSVDPDETVVQYTIEAIGDENIVISTDWPHDDSAYPRAIETFLQLDGVSEASKRKILWDNCARLYGIQ